MSYCFFVFFLGWCSRMDVEEKNSGFWFRVLEIKVAENLVIVRWDVFSMLWIELACFGDISFKVFFLFSCWSEYNLGQEKFNHRIEEQFLCWSIISGDAVHWIQSVCGLNQIEDVKFLHQNYVFIFVFLDKRPEFVEIFFNVLRRRLGVLNLT